MERALEQVQPVRLGKLKQRDAFPLLSPVVALEVKFIAEGVVRVAGKVEEIQNMEDISVPG